MDSYRTIFPKRHTFLTVIHVESASQAARNVAISRDYGADGTFLINHSISPEALFRIYADVRTDFPDFWIGLNVLGLTPLKAMRRMPPVLQANFKGLWADNSGIDSEAAGQFNHYRKREIDWPGIYFGGVAFKHQADAQLTDQEAAAAAVRATSYMDVVTTSGPRTGSPPSVSKIKTMKGAIGDTPLAIASGMTIDNIDEYLPFTDCVLVATGVSSTFTDLSSRKTMLFHDRCEAFNCRSR